MAKGDSALANPRNAASGALRLLDPAQCSARCAWEVLAL